MNFNIKVYSENGMVFFKNFNDPFDIGYSYTQGSVQLVTTTDQTRVKFYSTKDKTFLTKELRPQEVRKADGSLYINLTNDPITDVNNLYVVLAPVLSGNGGGGAGGVNADWDSTSGLSQILGAKPRIRQVGGEIRVNNGNDFKIEDGVIIIKKGNTTWRIEPLVTGELKFTREGANPTEIAIG